MLGRSARVGELPLVLDAAEIRTLEQLGREDDFRALARRLTHQLGNRADVRDRVVGEGELQRGDGELGHAADLGTSTRHYEEPKATWQSRRKVWIASLCSQ